MAFRVENETVTPLLEPAGEAYGGLAILKRLGTLFEWRDLTYTNADGGFVAAWRAPASERGAAGQAD